MKYCHSKSDIPSGPHWAIVEFVKVFIPGDERSRTNPGHGYPASTETYANYVAYDNEDEWKKEVQTLSNRVFSEKNFVAMKVVPAKITTTINVEVE